MDGPLCCNCARKPVVFDHRCMNCYKYKKATKGFDRGLELIEAEIRRDVRKAAKGKVLAQ